MKTCLIFGQNGLDLDVAFNLQDFYSRIGFKTFFGEKICNADLLVIVRAINKPLNLDKYNFSQIHVYDYGGWGYDKCIETLDCDKTYVFTTSNEKKNNLIDNLLLPSERVFVTFPPVSTQLWVMPYKKERKYDFVHIGNFKKIDDSDAISVKFHKVIEKLHPHIWGIGWNNQSKKYHGKLGLFDVSKIYSKSKYSLGLMYPFQRKSTFSGRFWHAPLNGCYLFSEPGLYTNEIPGVIEVNYNIEEINELTTSLLDFREVQQKSIDFWDNKFLEHQNLVLMLLEGVKYRSTYGFNFFLFKFINILRYYYQKVYLFKR